MDNRKAVNLTEGVIWKQLLKFVWPIILSNIFQQLYNITNSMIVGNFVSKEALSAVSACTSILNLFNFFFHGIATACGILTSTYFGARNHEKLNSVIETSLMISIMLGLGLTVFGEIFTPQLLAFSNIGPSIYTDSEIYLRIYLLGNVSVLLYNITFFILRSLGDSRSPLYYLMGSCITNIVLGIIFVKFLNLSVIGVALATLISQTAVDFFALRMLNRMKNIISFDWKHMHISWDLARQMARLGIPAAIQNMLVAFSSMVVQSHVNLFSNEVIAGIGVADKVGHWVQIPMQSIATIGTNYVGQNLGAQKYDRVQQGIRICNRIATVITAICAVGAFFSAEFFVGLFNNDPEIIHHGATMLRYSVFSYIPLTWSHIYNNCCRGAGNMKLPLVIAVTSQCIFKYVFVTVGLRLTNNNIQIIYLSNLFTFVLAGVLAAVYFHFSRFTKEARLRP